MSAVGACASKSDRAQLQNYLRARCDVNGSGRDCRLLKLTANRVFVESFVPAITGSRVALRFCLPNGHQVRAAGVVTNHQFQSGFDVDFVDISTDDRNQISSFVA